MKKSKKLRSSLCKFISKETVAGADLKELRDLLKSESSPIFNFIRWYETEYESVDFFPPAILALLRCISSVSPVLSYFAAFERFRSLLSEMQAGINVRGYPEKLSVVQRIAPIIYSAIVCLPGGEMPPEMLQVFAALEERVKWITKKRAACSRTSACRL